MNNKWIHFDIDRENGFGLICGFVMILLSVAMTWFHSTISNIILRDVFMILILGFHLPIYYIVVVKNKSLSVLGFHKNKLIVSLVINVAAASALLAIFTSKSTEKISFNQYSFYAIAYILVAGIFEMVFIYGFLRYEFERAFGILPAIFLLPFFTVYIMQVFNQNLQNYFLLESCMLWCSILQRIYSQYFHFFGVLVLFGTF